MFSAIGDVEVIVDNVKWEGMNEIKLINTNEGLVLEFCNEALTDKMYDKIIELYKSHSKLFYVQIKCKRSYQDGSSVIIHKKIHCRLPKCELINVFPRKDIVDLNLKALILPELRIK